MKAEVGTITTKGQLVIPAKLAPQIRNSRRNNASRSWRRATASSSNRSRPVSFAACAVPLKGRALDILYEERKRDREL